ncbi:putative cardiolipin synthase YwiE [Parapedobacter defluvii]|uniref:Cardiolipin synthase n=1 Tax=Parapedobacter defluvii TaxID=2045106 RepID=A0ABQ1L8Z2_9SPHI|nr:cardiolipin synthase [Parapedobacter defluvii]GGC19144.1 putative cardiolipin synthase YwiE [Parapedobacter defluvii]
MVIHSLGVADIMQILHQIGAFIYQWYWIPLLLVYVAIIVTILIENRNPTKTIAWIMVIVFVPVVGIVFYYFFGQKFKRVKVFRIQNREKHTRLLSVWNKLNPIMDHNLEVLRQSIGPLSRVFTFLKNQRIAPPSLHNHVELLINGEQKFPELLRAIREAEHHIHLEYYIFDPDDIGLALISLLKEKASAGVTVRIIVDAFGSPKLRRRRKRFEKAGIQFIPFMPVTFTSLANGNYRNHRKIAIIDGHTAFVGGINISDRYVNSGKYPLYWRDTAVKIQGDAVNVLQVHFWMNWHLAEGSPFNLRDGYFHTVPVIPAGHSAVSFAFSDPGSNAPFNMEAMLIGIAEAAHTVRICTPYFIPSDELSTTLQLAAASGVQVELMLPARSDSFLVQHASFSFLKPLLERGVSVYLYEKGFLHAKTICIDGRLAYIGTVNLDIRSFYINFEVSAVISDRDLCAQLDTQFEKDKSDSTLMTRAIWMRRPRWKRGMDSVCRLLTPLL